MLNETVLDKLEGVDLTRVCDYYCKFPSNCLYQGELDSICDECPFYNLLLLLDEVGIVKRINS